MTIAACFEFDDGIVFCADTKITTGLEKTNQRKIFPNLYHAEGGPCATVFVLSGSLPFAKAAIAESEARISQLDLASASMEEVRKEIESALVAFYQMHVFPNPDLAATDFGLLAGVWLRGETAMYSSHKTTVTPIRGYECLGAGAYLAKYWIRKFFASEPRGPKRQPRTLEDIGLISAYALNSAMEYDEYCGGEAEFLVMTNAGEIGFDVDARIYPCEQLPDLFHSAMWRMLRKLVRADDKLDADFILSDFESEVRKIGNVKTDWIDTLSHSLKSSIESKPSTRGQASTSESE